MGNCKICLCGSFTAGIADRAGMCRIDIHSGSGTGYCWYCCYGQGDCGGVNLQNCKKLTKNTEGIQNWSPPVFFIAVTKPE